MGNRSMFVGLDVHKETIDVSIAEGRRDGEVRHYGVIASDLEPLDKVVRALKARDRKLHFVYEAGPCGFGIYRHLTKRGEHCVGGSSRGTARGNEDSSERERDSTDRSSCDFERREKIDLLTAGGLIGVGRQGKFIR